MRLCLALFVCAVNVFGQAPSASGVVNAASFANVNLPNGSIAQGSMFTVFGSNLGPASPATPASFPLSDTLGGTSVTVTSGGTTLSCPMVVSFSGQTSAIMPSGTPTGDATLTIATAGGQTTIPVKVVAHSPGVFALSSAGVGPGVQTNPAFTVNSLVSSAKAGEAWDVWATGLGAITASDAGAPPVGNLPYEVKVSVGGKDAAVLYAGRSGCCAALDQIRFVVPDGVSGCYVPVVVTANGVPSNFTTMSVTTSGEVCSDPAAGWTSDLITKGQQQGEVRIGEIALQRLKLSVQVFGQTFDQNIDTATADYTKYSFSELIRRLGPVRVSGENGCVVYQFAGSQAAIVDPVAGMGLEAGDAGNLQGPGGSKSIPRVSTGDYFVSSGIDLGGFSFLTEARKLLAAVGEKEQFGSSGFLGQGPYTVSLPGGADVGAHTAAITVPQQFTWTNKGQFSAISRDQPLTVQFSGGAADATAQIFGFSAYAVTENSTSGAMFFCRGSAAAGSYTVPASVLQALPVSATAQGLPTGVLGVGSITFGTFTAPGIDQGIVSQVDVNMTAVTYQ